MKEPTFQVYVGPMFSSKTTALFLELERFKHQHKKIVAFKPVIDDRYHAIDIVTHGGWTYPAIGVKAGVDIIESLSEMPQQPDVVAVDEAFMIPGIAEVLIWLYRNGINVVVSTLDISATGKPFHEVEKMLAWATYVEKCCAVCTICGNDAHFSHKKNESDPEIKVGGAELYEPRCALHHPCILNQEVLMSK